MFSADAFFRLLKYSEEEAVDYKNTYLPEYVYKYYSFSDGNKDMYEKKMETLRKKQIYFSAIKDFNDPFEFKSLYIEKKLFEDEETEKYNESALEASKLRLFMDQNTIRVACFVENMKNIPMWAYYADSFRGYCIKYKVTNKKHFFRVEYIKDRIPTFHPKCVFTDKSEKTFLEVAQLLSTKAYKWKHEKEIRLAVKIDDTNRFDEGILLPCEKLGLEPVEIIAGCNCSDYNIEALKTVNMVGKLNLPMKKLELKEDKFEFKLKRI